MFVVILVIIGMISMMTVIVTVIIISSITSITSITIIIIIIIISSSTGCGLRFSTEVYGSKWERVVFHGNLQEACFVLAEISGHLPKPPGAYGSM